MANILLLEGDSGVGKSTLIYQQWLKNQPQLGGFFVKRLDPENKLGFSICDATSFRSFLEPPTTEMFVHQFINHQNRVRYDPEPFDIFGAELLKQARLERPALILLDELGGIELLAQSFYDELIRLLLTESKIIGVFKSDKNFQHQKKRMALPDLVAQRRQKILTLIQQSDGRLCSLTSENRSDVTTTVRQFLTE